jgi:hypothetical protein
MTSPPTSYEIVVSGHLDDRWSDWFGDVALRRSGDGTTCISAQVADQAQLYGLLAGLRDLNATLLSVQAGVPDSSAVSPAVRGGGSQTDPD